MAPESDPIPVTGTEPGMNQNTRIRLVLQRLASGYYNRRDVWREVAERMLLREEM